MMTSIHASGLAGHEVRPTNPLTRIARFARGAALARRERAELASLDDAALKDIGVSREEALAEARRPLWDVPRYWRQ